MPDSKKYLIDTITKPIQRFIDREKSGGIVLAISVVLALILANSPWSEDYHSILNYKLGFEWGNSIYFKYSLHQWISDGLMAVFFFVVGLELKREIVGGELSHFKKALLPISAALGGIILPACIYLLFNPSGEVSKGWGIPMATDIAFALGVLHLLGNRIPLSVKVFLTALAIVDDLCAILVIGVFYTADISVVYLSIALGILLVMYAGNRMGVRNILFYSVLGIGGVWTAFLLSGIHATLAAVLAAFVIPANVKIKEQVFTTKLQNSLNMFSRIDPKEDQPTLTIKQLHVLEDMSSTIVDASPPLQRLERAMHPLVTFLIIPIFALANAGFSFDIDIQSLFDSNIVIGVAAGLLVGKVAGIVGITLLLLKLKVVQFPDGMNQRNLVGVSFLAAIGFTMSLFITSLAFNNEEFIIQAKTGIFLASIIGGLVGYMILYKRNKRPASLKGLD